MLTPASAQQQRPVVSRPQEPMRFLVAEGAGPRGAPRWVAAIGQIRVDTPKVFATFRAAQKIDGLPVVLDSPGGSVNGGMALGRELRKLKATVHVGRTLETGGGDGRLRHRVDDSESQCNSACVLVLMGGERREVTRRAHVGVHLFSGALRPDGTSAREVPTVQDIEDAQRTMVRHAIYVREMGVDLGVLELMAEAPFKGMRRIQPPEIEKLKLATLVDSLGAAAPTVAGWSFRRSAENPVLSRTVPMLNEPRRVADQEVVLSCSSYRGFVLMTYRQTLRRLESGADFIAINRVRVVAGREDHVLRPNAPLLARRQGDDLWLRRETPMALVEAALDSRQLKVEPLRNGATLPTAEMFDPDFARFAPELLKACQGRRDLATVGPHPRH